MEQWRRGEIGGVPIWLREGCGITRKGINWGLRERKAEEQEGEIYRRGGELLTAGDIFGFTARPRLRERDGGCRTRPPSPLVFCVEGGRRHGSVLAVGAAAARVLASGHGPLACVGWLETVNWSPSLHRPTNH